MDEANLTNFSLSSICPIDRNPFSVGYVALASFYSMVGVASIMGNLTVVGIVLSKKEMMTITNLFVCNLAISDLIVCTTSLWMTPLYSYSQFWTLGKFMCYFAQFSPALSVFVSTYTLVGIAIDRYTLIMHPLASKMSNWQFVGSLLAIWSVSSMLALPLLIHTDYHEFGDCHYAFCLETGWEPTFSRFVYGIVVLLVKTVIPFGFMSLCYYRISTRLKRQAERFAGRQYAGENAENSAILKSRKLNRILISMVVLFGVCSLPLDTLNLFRDSMFVFELKLADREPLKIVGMICHLIAMAATLLNPLMYAWWNENFKREIQRRANCSHTEFVVKFQSSPAIRVSIQRKSRSSSSKRTITNERTKPIELKNLLNASSHEDQLEPGGTVSPTAS